MEALTSGVLAHISAGVAPVGELSALGAPEPERAAAALLQAARHPDLGASAHSWIPALLPTARPGFAAQCLEELADLHRRSADTPFDCAHAPTLPLVLGSSDTLARLLLRHPTWLDELSGDTPAAPSTDPIEPNWTAIRTAKYRGLLRIAARDLAERPFSQSLGELSDLADRCLEAALTCAARESEADPPALIGLGKLGGRELNFSSDVDLLFIDLPSEGEEDVGRREAAERLVRLLKRQMEAPSEDGFGYRVDLELRPEGRNGALTNPLDSALYYYETFGADWERQMLIRARPIAGPAVGRRFCNEIEPFVYRAAIDPAAIRAVRDMKGRIEEDRRRRGRDLEYDLKEGPGGIRDVEFLVQALQLFSGGTLHEFRTGNVLRALDVAAQHSLLPEGTPEALAHAYTWLRRAEHGVQMNEERHSHRVPRDPAAQLALSRRIGYREPSGSAALAHFLEDWGAIRVEVRRHFENLVLEAGSE